MVPSDNPLTKKTVTGKLSGLAYRIDREPCEDNLLAVRIQNKFGGWYTPIWGIPTIEWASAWIEHNDIHFIGFEYDVYVAKECSYPISNERCVV